MHYNYFQAVDNNSGKIIVKAQHLDNLLAVFDYVLPPNVDVYQVRQKKIM